MVSLKKFSFLIFLSIFLISLLTIFLFPSPSEAAIGDNEMVSAQYGNGNAETKSLIDWAKAHCQGKPSSCTRAFIDGFNQKYDGTTNRDKYCDGIDNKSDNCEKPYDAGAQLATAVTRVHLSKINDKKLGEIIAKYCEAYKNQSSGSAKEKEEQAGICALGFSAGVSLANKEAACNNLVTKDYEPVCKQSYDAGRKLALGQDPGKAAPGAPDSSETEPDCVTTFTNPLSWILCPVMHGGAKFTDFVFGSLVKPLLQSNPIGLDSDNGFYKAWQSFRNIANIMLIGILLIMVFSQLTEGWGLNVVDAYTAKKMAPRILIGVIAINLSIYLCIAAIDITNIIGSGIEYLLTQPFADSEVLNNAKLETNTESVATAGIGAAVIGGGAFAAGKFGLIAAASTNIGAVVLEGAMMFLVPLFITLFFVGLGVIITLVVRFGLIVFLTVVSPIAIACFILPGTEKYFKSWWNLFLKTLFVYPIIAVIFAMSDIMAVIFVQNSNEISDAAGLVSVLVGIVAVYMPLFLIPFAFKFAGGAIGAIAKIADEKGRGWSAKTKEGYANARKGDGFIGNMTKANKMRREEAGLTKRQIGSGAYSSVFGKKSFARDKDGNIIRDENGNPITLGGSARERYWGASKALGNRNALHELQNLPKENMDFGQVKLNDDALAAMQIAGRVKSRGGGTDEQRDAMFSHLVNSGYSQTDAAQWTDTASRAMAGMSGEMAELAAAAYGPATGTAFKLKEDGTGGGGAMLKSLVDAAHGNALLSDSILAMQLEGAKGSKRFDLAPSYAKARAARVRFEQRRSAGMNDEQNEIITAKEMRHEAYRAATAAEKINAKGEAADVFNLAIEESLDSVIDQGGEIKVDDKAGIVIERFSSEEQKHEAIMRQTAQVVGFYEQQGSASGRIQQTYQKIMGKQFAFGSLDSITQEHITNKRVEQAFQKMLAKQIEQTPGGREAITPEIMKTLRATATDHVINELRSKNLTMQELYGDVKDDPYLQQMRREWLDATEAKTAEQLEAARQAGEQKPPPQPEG